MTTKPHSELQPKIYDGDGDVLMEADRQANRLVIMPSGDPRKATKERDQIRTSMGTIFTFRHDGSKIQNPCLRREPRR